MTSAPPVLPTVAARRRSWLVKVTSIIVLLGLLHIPLALTRGVLSDRQGYQLQAVGDITSVWGREQHVTGPILAVPYTYRATVPRTKLVNGQWVQVEENGVCEAVAFFLPEELRVEGTVDPEIRSRGIYDAVVYTTHLTFGGVFRPDFTAAGIEAEHVAWEKTRVLFGLADLHGLRSVGPLRGADRAEVAFDSTDTGPANFLPLSANVGLPSAGPVEFTFDAIVQGSGSLTFDPVGKNTSTNLRSGWRAPSFTGAWLPVERRVGADGFTATWRVSQFSRGFPQSWTSRVISGADMSKKIGAASFGVRFARGVDGYGMVERAQKYGILFFVLIFAVFFLFEVTAELRIHPLQYAMVGAALCLFFLGFLALTEFWTTALAYAAAAGACTALVSLYAWSFLKTGWRTLVVLGGLGTTYGYLYFVLQSQDYALIAGTVALFAALALAMFCTRRINWYTLDANAAVRS